MKTPNKIRRAIIWKKEMLKDIASELPYREDTSVAEYEMRRIKNHIEALEWVME